MKRYDKPQEQSSNNFAYKDKDTLKNCLFYGIAAKIKNAYIPNVCCVFLF